MSEGFEISHEQAAKLLAEEMKATSLRMFQHTADQFNGLVRWLIASLLAVNGGGLVACLNADSITLDGKRMAGIAFAVGLSFAILSGSATIRTADKMLPEISKSMGYWAAISVHGKRDHSFEKELDEGMRLAFRGSKISVALGTLSFFALLAGLVLSGLNLLPSVHPAAPQRVEIVVKRDR